MNLIIVLSFVNKYLKYGEMTNDVKIVLPFKKEKCHQLFSWLLLLPLVSVPTPLCVTVFGLLPLVGILRGLPYMELTKHKFNEHAHVLH